MSADERESQLSAMFDGELPDSECELLARRLSRDPALKQQWARYSLIGAVIRNEPLHAHRAPGGMVGAGIAARLSRAIEAESAPAEADGGAEPLVAAAPVAFAAGDEVARGAAAGASRWLRPAAGVAIAAGVAALSVFWLQAREPQAVAPAIAAAEPVREFEVIAPPASTRGAAAEVVVAGNGYPAPASAAPASGSGEPESYVVPLPAERRGAAPPAQLANYAVAHSEYSGPLSRRSLLSALVAADASAGVPESAAEGGTVESVAEGDGQLGPSGPGPDLRSAEAPK